MLLVPGLASSRAEHFVKECGAMHCTCYRGNKSPAQGISGYRIMSAGPVAMKGQHRKETVTSSPWEGTWEAQDLPLVSGLEWSLNQPSSY